MIKMIVFDWDGVIVDTLPMLFNVYKKLIDEIRHKPNTKELIDYMEEHHGNGDMMRLDWKKHYTELGITDEKEIKLISQLFFKYMNLLKDQIKLFPGIKEVFAELKKNYKLAILSNSHSNFIKEKLIELSIIDYFDFIEAAEHGEGKMKPEPEFILGFLEKTGYTPREIAYVGDMDGDIIMAKAVGAYAIAVSYGYHSREKLKFHNPDYIIDAPEELLTALRQK